MSKFAWVTLTTNDTYSLGALVLAHSLRRAGTAHQLAVLVTPGVSESMRDRLKDVYNLVQEVNVMDSQDAANLALLARPELGVTFTKLHCWRLVQFEKCVFLDSDTLVLQNCDELFDREELSAAPDVSWPDCFNSGVFVYKPSLDTFGKITEYALKNGSFDGGDQGLLNSYFADWAHTDIQKHLPFVYNVTAYASYCYLPAFKQFRDKIKILHFAGKMKPWLIQFNSENKTASTPNDYAHAGDLIQLWWNIFCDNVHRQLTDNMKYWPTILQRNYFQKILNHKYKQTQYTHEVYRHQHHQEHQQHPEQLQQHEIYQQHHKQQEQHEFHAQHIYDFDNENVKEYRDPWEDYYEKLEKQVAEVEVSEPQEKCTSHVQETLDSEHHEKLNDYINVEEDSKTIETANERKLEQTNADINNDNSLSTKHVEMSTTKYTTESPQIYVEETHEEKYNDIEYAQQNQQRLEEETNTATSEDSDETHTTFLLDTKVTEDTITETHDTEDSIQVEELQTDNEAGLAGALSQLRLGEQRTPEQEAYEQLMRRQCWESGQVDYAGKDSFENIWKKISQTLEQKPAAAVQPSTKEDPTGPYNTSADVEDGKIEYDPDTKHSTQYKVIDGGYEVITTMPQPNGTVKTQVRTFYDPKPVTEEDLKNEQANKKLIKSRLNKEVRIDKNTTMLTRAIEGGYEEVYTTINEDGTRSSRTKTFFDSVPVEDPGNVKPVAAVKDKKKKALTKISSVDSTDSVESTRRVVQKTSANVNDHQANFNQDTTIEETRRVTQHSEYTENNRTVRKSSLQEQNLKAITSTSSDSKDGKKKKKKSAIPPPPPDFIENDTTTVSSSRVPGGVEYTYSTRLESGKTITTTKTVYEEEEVELSEQEIREYKKTLKDAEKHKNVTSTKKLKSESGTKKIVPSENPGEVTTVETIKIEGGTEYHYTTVTAEGIVKKATKTVYDAVSTKEHEDDTEEEEIVEEYEEEIIEPGEKNVRTITTTHKLPQKFEEEVTITHEKKEKKVKKSMMISQ